MPLDQTQRTGTRAAETWRRLFRSTGAYGHAGGMSCVLRQRRAGHSQCGNAASCRDADPEPALSPGLTRAGTSFGGDCP